MNATLRRHLTGFFFLVIWLAIMSIPFRQATMLEWDDHHPVRFALQLMGFAIVFIQSFSLVEIVIGKKGRWRVTRLLRTKPVQQGLFPGRRHLPRQFVEATDGQQERILSRLARPGQLQTGDRLTTYNGYLMAYRPRVIDPYVIVRRLLVIGITLGVLCIV